MKELIVFVVVVPVLFFSYRVHGQSEMDSSLSLLTSISGHMSPKSIVHSGNGQFFSQNMMYRHTVTVHDRTHKLVATIEDAITPSDYQLSGNEKLRGAPVECAFSHNGKYAWVSNYTMSGKGFNNPGCDACHGSKYDSSFVYKIDLDNYKIINAIAVGSVPKFIATAPNDSMLLVSNWSSGNVSLIDLVNEKEIKQIEVGTHPRGIAISPDSRTAYVAIMGSSKLVKINLKDYSKTVISDIGRGPRHLCIDPEGRYLYVSINGEGKIGKYDLISGSIEKIRTGRMPRSMALSEDGNFLYVVNYGDHKLTKVSTNDFTIRDQIKTGSKPIGVTIDNEMGRVWVSCYSGKINVFQDSILALHKSFLDRTLLALGNPADFIPEVRFNSDTMLLAKETPGPKKEEISAKLQPTIEAESKPANPNSSAYHIVAGSFSQLDNAKRAKLNWINQGFEAQVIKSEKGFHLISIACDHDKSVLIERLDQYKKGNDVGFWIYKGFVN